MNHFWSISRIGSINMKLHVPQHFVTTILANRTIVHKFEPKFAILVSPDYICNYETLFKMYSSRKCWKMWAFQMVGEGCIYAPFASPSYAPESL